MSDLTANQVDALLDALRSALESAPEDGGAMTTEELATKEGCTVETMRKRLKLAIKAGTVEPTKAKRAAMDGRVQLTPAYRLKS